jgi:nucleotide-binding universal stress UspA family protein
MPDIKSVLFPVDFSLHCRGVAPFVRAVAEHFRAQVTLIHGIAIPPEYYVSYGVNVSAALRTELRNSTTSSLQAFANQEFRSASVQKVIEEGDAAEVIAGYAAKQKVDLIMMPTHGFGPLRRFLLGSVTAKVLHDAQCPVWTSVHTDTPVAPPRECRTILCALDSGESSVPLMQWASWLAGTYPATLKLVHVIPAVNETSMIPGERDVRRYLFEQAREEFALHTKKAGVDIQVRLRGGEITPGIVDTAIEEKADLLVVGRGRVQRALGGLRSHSLDIIREAPCPVISV